MKKLILPILMMAGIVALSNILVAYPLPYQLAGIDLSNWLTFGAFTYPLAFLVTDLTNRSLGAKAARMVIIPGFVTGIALSLLLADFRIALASGTAFMLAQLLDVSLFNRMRAMDWWKAPLISSASASVLDTGLFFSLAFAGTAVPWVGLAIGDLMVKLAMALILLPCFYWLSQLIGARQAHQA
ncbi:MAG: queuosine precursor transporter [Alphaproteobacteria bacterium]